MLSSARPSRNRARLSQNSSMLRSSTRPLDHDVWGVMMRFGRVPERRVGRQRLFPERVQDGAADGAVAQRPEQGPLVDEPPRATLMSQAPGFIRASVRASMRFVGVASSAAAPGPPCRSRPAAPAAGRGSRIRSMPSRGPARRAIAAVGIAPGGDDARAEGQRQPGHGAPDGPEADDAHRDCRHLRAGSGCQVRSRWSSSSWGSRRMMARIIISTYSAMGSEKTPRALVMIRPRPAAAGVSTRSTPGRRGVDPGEPGAARQDALEGRRRQRPAEHHLDVVERAVARAPRARRSRVGRRAQRRGCAPGPPRGSAPTGWASARWPAGLDRRRGHASAHQVRSRRSARRRDAGVTRSHPGGAVAPSPRSLGSVAGPSHR